MHLRIISQSALAGFGGRWWIGGEGIPRVTFTSLTGVLDWSMLEEGRRIETSVENARGVIVWFASCRFFVDGKVCGFAVCDAKARLLRG